MSLSFRIFFDTSLLVSFLAFNAAGIGLWLCLIATLFGKHRQLSDLAHVMRLLTLVIGCVAFVVILLPEHIVDKGTWYGIYAFATLLYLLIAMLCFWKFKSV